MEINIAPRSIWSNPLHFLAFGLGSGASPYAPGTVGTAMAIPFYLLLRNFSLFTYCVILFLAIIVGFYLCEIATNAVKVHDHPGIVWDEFVGYWLTMIAAPPGFIWIIVGFILFRIFDIWKPWPIHWVNQHVRNGIGIVLDDLMAGVLAWVVMRLLIWVAYQWW